MQSLKPIICVSIVGCMFGRSAPLSAQTMPVIQNAGIVNAANYTPPDFPGGAIAQGSLFGILGSGLGPAAGVQPKAFPLQTSLGGVSVKVTGGGTSVDALPLYVSSTQINAIMPSNTPVGAVQITVTYNSATSAAVSAQVVKTDLGLFSIAGSGMGPAVVQNFMPAALPVNSTARPATPGQRVILYGTGLGPALNADNVPPQGGNLPVSVSILVGGIAVSRSYSGRSPCCSGLDQISFNIPQNAALGCHVPVQIVTGDGAPTNTVSIAISSDGEPCTDSAAPFGPSPTSGKSGIALLLHSTVYPNGTAPVAQGSADLVEASFRSETGGAFAFNPLFSIPPAGTCAVYLATGDVFKGALIPGFAATAGPLDAGPLTVKNGSSSVVVSSSGGAYQKLLGIDPAVPGFGGPFLTGGAYSITGTGSEVGAFTVSLTDGPAFTWKNPAVIVNRAAGLTVNWTLGGSAASSIVLILGGVFDAPANRTEMFLCSASADAATFTVPAEILSRLPASHSDARLSTGVVMAGALPAQPQATFTATGIDSGFASAASMSAAIVQFQ